MQELVQNINRKFHEFQLPKNIVFTRDMSTAPVENCEKLCARVFIEKI